jgi:hypothetical protein
LRSCVFKNKILLIFILQCGFETYEDAFKHVFTNINAFQNAASEFSEQKRKIDEAFTADRLEKARKKKREIDELLCRVCNQLMADKNAFDLHKIEVHGNDEPNINEGNVDQMDTNGYFFF